jgi:hypothetical protein
MLVGARPPKVQKARILTSFHLYLHLHFQYCYSYTEKHEVSGLLTASTTVLGTYQYDRSFDFLMFSIGDLQNC